MNGPLLVILPHNPGDVVMALLAVARIRAACPGLAVDYVVGEECRELAEGNPLIRRAFPLPRRRLREAFEAGDAGTVLAALEGFLDGLDAGGYACSLNLFQERYGGILQGLVRADRKAGLELVEGRHFAVRSRYLEHLFAVPAARRDNGWHAVDLYVRAARESLDPGNRLAWPLPAAGTPCLPGLRPPEGWDGGEGHFAFHPGSAWPGKRWPEAHWTALAAACARAGHDVVLTGSPEERPVVDRVLSALPADARARVRDWSGRTTLLGAAWIYAHARMTVAGDTVAMHLASACGAPTLALFGPSNPVETGPYGRGHFVLQTSLELPSALDLGAPHAGLGELSPGQVAAFLLEGSAPRGVSCWETGRDPDRDCQVLRGPDGGLHPHQRRAAPLMDWLDGRTARRPGTGSAGGGKARIPEGARAGLREALGRCLARGAHPSDLLALESAERDLAAATGDSVVWEAYRIAVNGLSLRDIRRHLELRRDRFEAALREEEAQAGPAPA